MFTRHDIPGEVKNVIDVALENDVIDSYELYVLANEHKENWKGLVNDIVNIAYTWNHVDKSKHINVVKAAEDFWKVEEDRKCNKML